METVTVNTDNDRKITLDKRIASKKNSETILFIHGFGCNKDSFRNCFESNSMIAYNLIVPSLPGHTHSDLPFDYTSNLLENSARILLSTMDALEFQHFHIVGHSMGGLIGVLLYELFPGRVKSFINLEGNLSLEDCNFTGLFTKYSFQSFQGGGREEIMAILTGFEENDQPEDRYIKMFRSISDETLYYTAMDTVRLSREPNLINRFKAISKACYVYGEKNRGKLNSEKSLITSGLAVYYIKNAGHAMQDDNPEELYKLIHDYVEELL